MADLKIVKVNVGETPEVQVIPHSLDEMYKIVGGWIETVRIADDLLLIVDEEGLLKNKGFNFLLSDVQDGVSVPLCNIVGNCLFVAYEGEEFTSLNDEQIERVLKMFRFDRKYCMVGC